MAEKEFIDLNGLSTYHDNMKEYVDNHDNVVMQNEISGDEGNHFPLMSSGYEEGVGETYKTQNLYYDTGYDTFYIPNIDSGYGTIKSDSFETHEINVKVRDDESGGDISCEGNITGYNVNASHDITADWANIRTKLTGYDGSINALEIEASNIIADSAELSGELQVDGYTTLNNNTWINDDLAIDGGLNVSGSTSVGSLYSSNNISAHGKISADTNIEADGTISARQGISTNGNVSVGGNLTVTGSANLGSMSFENLDVSNELYAASGYFSGFLSGYTVNVGDNVTVAHNISTGRDLEVGRDATVAGNLSVDGSLSASNISFSDTTIDGDLTVTGKLDSGELDTGTVRCNSLSTSGYIALDGGNNGMLFSNTGNMLIFDGDIVLYEGDVTTSSASLNTIETRTNSALDTTMYNVYRDRISQTLPGDDDTRLGLILQYILEDIYTALDNLAGNT